MDRSGVWTLPGPPRQGSDVSAVRHDAESAAADSLERPRRAGARRRLPGRPAGRVRSDRRTASAPGLSAVLSLRRQPRRRERSVAGRVPARVPGAPELPRPVLDRHLALPHRRERLPQSREREKRWGDRADRRSAVRGRAARSPPPIGSLKDERAARVRAAIAQLPPKQRATLILRMYHEMSHQEIADALGSSVGAVKANFFHALANLKKLLGEEDL